ncbi:tetratricopeptide repeat protein [bacterium]|nr:tetratricopeptide repeat protein [candidate division CSSED10-310 bacterium]
MATKDLKKSIDLKIIAEEQPAFINRVAQFVATKRDTIGYIVVAIVVVATIGFLMKMNSTAKENEAAVQFQNAVKQYQKDMTATSISLSAKSDTGDPSALPEMKVQTQSIGAFQAVFDNYPGTHAGHHALYMIAVSQLNQGLYEEAIASFDNFVEKSPDSPLTASGIFGKATAQFNAGHIAESLETLESIDRSHPNFKLKDVLLYETARRLESLNRKSEARNQYESIIERYPDSPWKAMSEKALEKLDVSNGGDDNKTT